MSLLGNLDSEHRRKVASWQKATIVHGYDGSIYRKDTYGWWIAWSEYGQLTEYGWEIDHIYPASRGGSDDIGNLQALHWRVNRAKSNKLG